MHRFLTRSREFVLAGLFLGILPLSSRFLVSEPSEPLEDQGAWISLFDGESLKGWTPKITGYEAGDNFGETFRVNDGAIQVSYEAYEDEFRGRFGHLFYEVPFSHYIFRLEYRFIDEQIKGGPGWAYRNSGVMIHGQTPESMTKDQKFPASIEVQLLGGDGENPRTTGNLCTPGTHVVMDGKLHRQHCQSSTSATYHGEEWVSLEIEVRGNEWVRHEIEGKTVLQYQQPQLDPDDGSAKALIAAGQDVMLSGGTISLQSESHPCEFRHIQIRDLSGE